MEMLRRLRNQGDHSKDLAEALIQISGGKDELRLGQKWFGDTRMARIAEGIRASGEVVTLELFKNSLTDACAGSLCDILAMAPLELLDLSDNKLTGKTASVLRLGLEAPSCTLRRLLPTWQHAGRRWSLRASRGAEVERVFGRVASGKEPHR